MTPALRQQVGLAEAGRIDTDEYRTVARRSGVVGGILAVLPPTDRARRLPGRQPWLRTTTPVRGSAMPLTASIPRAAVPHDRDTFTARAAEKTYVPLRTHRAIERLHDVVTLVSPAGVYARSG